MDHAQPILQVRGLCKTFPVYQRGIVRRRIGTVRAVSDVSFDLLPGEILGLVGESGCGKTTLARSILRAIRPTQGQVWFRFDGRSVDLARLTDRQLKPLRTRMQMVFQDPYSSLNPRMTVEQIVGEPLVIHRLARGRELTRRVTEVLRQVGLGPEHLRRYPHEFSGGQRQRIGIARALVMRPALVVADEPVSALDVSIQAQVLNLLAELQETLGLTYIVVAHDLSVIRHLATRVAVMYAGRVVELAPTQDLFRRPQHPYTEALLAAVPSLDPDVRLQARLTGEVADPARLPPGCAFHPRCPKRFAACDQQEPALVACGPGHHAACLLVDPAAPRPSAT